MSKNASHDKRGKGTEGRARDPWSSWNERQMFDPPLEGRYMICGRPLSLIPESEKKYADFLTWWREVGSLNPEDASDWSSVSGPRVMRDRVELIPPQDWLQLEESERSKILNWSKHIRTGMFYD